jgi:hypothetical protein
VRLERFDGYVAATGAIGLLWLMKRYSVTSYGPNHWTPEALFNTATRVRCFERAREAIEGRINSAYRSPAINKAVGGVPTSRHMRGLALDLRPGGIHTPETASAKLWELASSGELGRVHKVIWEPTWVHISWRSVTEGPHRMSYGRIPRNASALPRAERYTTLDRGPTV